MTNSGNPARANIDQLNCSAFEHCIFPLATIEDVRWNGPNIYALGQGIGLTDQNGRTYIDMMSSHTRSNSLAYDCEEIAHAIYEQLVRVQRMAEEQAEAVNKGDLDQEKGETEEQEVERHAERAPWLPGIFPTAGWISADSKVSRPIAGQPRTMRVPVSPASARPIFSGFVIRPSLPPASR